MPRTHGTASGWRAGRGSDRAASSRPRARSSNIGPARIRCVASRQGRSNPRAERLNGTRGVAPMRTRQGRKGKAPPTRSQQDPWGNVASFPDRTKYVARCLSKMRLLLAPRESVSRAVGSVESMPDHTRAEVEGHDQGEGLVRAARDQSSLFRHQGETDVRGQPQGADRDDIAKDRREAVADMTLVRSTMDEPGSGGPEDVAPEDLQDRQEVGRNAPQGRVLTEKPRGEACEAQEDQYSNEPRMVRWRLRRRE